jgi:hypothetical protein
MRSVILFSILSYAAAALQNYDGCSENSYFPVNSRCQVYDAVNREQTTMYSIDDTEMLYAGNWLNDMCTDETKYCDVYYKPIIQINIPGLHEDQCAAGTYLQKSTPIVYFDQSDRNVFRFYDYEAVEGMTRRDDGIFVANICRDCPAGRVAPIDKGIGYPVKVFDYVDANGESVYNNDRVKLLRKTSQETTNILRDTNPDIKGEEAFIFSNSFHQWGDQEFYMDIFDMNANFVAGTGGRRGKVYKNLLGVGEDAFALDQTDFILPHMKMYFLEATTQEIRTGYDSHPYTVFQDPRICVSCPSGKGAFDGKYCKECPEGQVPNNGVCTGCPQGTERINNVCKPCGFGKYNDEVGSVCESCDQYKTTTQEGSISDAACKLCSNGQEVKSNMRCGSCENGFAGTGGICRECASLAANPLRTNCLICEEGQGGIEGECTTCPKGTKSVTSDGINHRCVSCPAGTYQDSTGQTVCTSCAAGKATPDSTGFTEQAYCDFCDRNTVPKDGTCQPCEAGKVSTVGDTQCDYCPAGEYYEGGTCKVCAKGTIKTEALRQDPDQPCQECFRGHQIDSDHTQCRTCGPGKEFSAADGTCVQCSLGKYSNDEYFCESCPAGSFSDDRKTCKSCVRGKYTEQADQTSCKDCEMGTYSPFTGASNQTYCIPCAAGMYQDDFGSTICKECPLGYASDPLPKPRKCSSSCPNPGERYSGGVCAPCETGKYLDSDRRCKVCPAGTKSTGETCVACPDGEYFNPELVRLTGPHGDILTKYQITDFDITSLGDETWLQLPGEHTWVETDADCSSTNSGTFLSHVDTNDGYGQEITGDKGDEHAKLSTYMCSQRCQTDDEFFVYMYEHEQYCGCGKCILNTNDGVTQYKKPEKYLRRNTKTDFTIYDFLTTYQNRMEASDTCQPCPAGSVSTLDRKGCESRKGDFYHNSDTGITERSPKIIFQGGDGNDYTVEIDGISYKDPDIRVCKEFKVYRNLSGHRLQIAAEDSWSSDEAMEERVISLEVGIYDYYCTVYSHREKMRGKIIVEDCEEKIVPCETGYFRDQRLCTPCPKGQTSDGITCSDCPDYETSLGDGQCIPCPKGTGYKNCERCPAGRFSDEEGIDCKSCSKGTFSIENRTACTDVRADATCEQGEYLKKDPKKYPGTCNNNRCEPDIDTTQMLTCSANVPDGYQLVDVQGYGNLYKAEENQDSDGPSAGFKDTPSDAKRLNEFNQAEPYVPNAFKTWGTALLPEETTECHDDVMRLKVAFHEKVSSVCKTHLSATECQQYAGHKSLTFDDYTSMSGTDNYDYEGCFELNSKIYYGTGYVLTPPAEATNLHFYSQVTNNGRDYGGAWDAFPTHLSLTKNQCDTKRGSDSTGHSLGPDDAEIKENECYKKDGSAQYNYPYHIVVPKGKDCSDHGLQDELTKYCGGNPGSFIDSDPVTRVGMPASRAGVREYFHNKEMVKDESIIAMDWAPDAVAFSDLQEDVPGAMRYRCIVTDDGYFKRTNDATVKDTFMKLCTNQDNRPVRADAYYLRNKVSTISAAGYQSLYNEADYFLKQKYTNNRVDAKPICFGQSDLSSDSSDYDDSDFKKTFPVVTASTGKFTCLNNVNYVLDTTLRRKQGNDFLIHLLGERGNQENELHNSGIKRSKWISQIKHNCNHLTNHNYDSYDFTQLTKMAFKDGEQTKHFDLRDCITSKQGIVLDSPTWKVYSKANGDNVWIDQRVYNPTSFLFHSVDLICDEYRCDECGLFASKSSEDYSECLQCTMETALRRHQCQGCPAGKKIPEITDLAIPSETCEMCPAGKFSSGASAKMLVTDVSSPIYNTTDTWSGLHCFDACNGYPLEDNGLSVECTSDCPANQYHDGTECVDFICIGGVESEESEGSEGSVKLCSCPSNEELRDGVCKPCPYGQIFSGDKCESCPSFKIYKNGNCESCPQGQIPDAGKCKACPFGKTSGGTDDTQCVACPDGETSYGDGICIDCPPGVSGSGGSCDFAAGCTDSDACNYNPLAAVDDGSCELFDETYPSCQRCVDKVIGSSPDTNENGFCDDEDIGGCMIPEACNFDKTANLEAECNMKVSEECDTCDNNGNVIEGDVNPKNNVCDDKEVTGCNTVGACNYNPDVTIPDPNLCNIRRNNGCDTCKSDGTVNEDFEDPGDDDSICEKQEMPGCMTPGRFNYDAGYNVVGEECYPIIRGCMDATAFNFIPKTDNKNVDVNTDDGSCIPVVEGCMDPIAKNYNNTANTDDGSCYPIIRGCMDPTACNYIFKTGNTSVDANTDDGSCRIPKQGAPECEICKNQGTKQGEPESTDEDSNKNGICDQNDYRVCNTQGACNYLMTEDGSTIHRLGDPELDGALNRDCVFANPDNAKGGLSVRCRDKTEIQSSLQGTTKEQRIKYRQDVMDAYSDIDFNFYPILQQREPGEYHEHFDGWSPYDLIYTTTCGDRDPANDRCDLEDIVGCKNPDACNYSPLANYDSGPDSCRVPIGCQVCDGEYVETGVEWCNHPVSCAYDPSITDDPCMVTSLSDYICGSQPSEYNCNYCDGSTLVIPDAEGSSCYENRQEPTCIGNSVYFKPYDYGVTDIETRKCRPREFMLQLIRDRMSETCELPMDPPESFDLYPELGKYYMSPSWDSYPIYLISTMIPNSVDNWEGGTWVSLSDFVFEGDTVPDDIPISSFKDKEWYIYSRKMVPRDSIPYQDTVNFKSNFNKCEVSGQFIKVGFLAFGGHYSWKGFIDAWRKVAGKNIYFKPLRDEPCPLAQTIPNIGGKAKILGLYEDNFCGV